MPTSPITPNPTARTNAVDGFLSHDVVAWMGPGESGAFSLCPQDEQKLDSSCTSFPQLLQKGKATLEVA